LRHYLRHDQASRHRLHGQANQPLALDSPRQQPGPDSQQQGDRVQKRGNPQQPGTERLQTSVKNGLTLLTTGQRRTRRTQLHQSNRRLRLVQVNALQQRDRRADLGNQHPTGGHLPICAKATLSGLLPAQASEHDPRHSPRAVLRSLRLDPRLARNLDR
jgi:hypothetical protein